LGETVCAGVDDGVEISSYEHGAPALMVIESVTVFFDRHGVEFGPPYYLLLCNRKDGGSSGQIYSSRANMANAKANWLSVFFVLTILCATLLA
jgi:hypothetical protein